MRETWEDTSEHSIDMNDQELLDEVRDELGEDDYGSRKTYEESDADVTFSLPELVRISEDCFRCPICLELLTDTVAAMDCLHRFCSDCVSTWLQKGSKECPVCKKKIATRRSLRADDNMNQVIQAVWPDRRVFERAVDAVSRRTVAEADTEGVDVESIENTRIPYWSRMVSNLASNNEQVASGGSSNSSHTDEIEEEQEVEDYEEELERLEEEAFVAGVAEWPDDIECASTTDSSSSSDYGGLSSEGDTDFSSDIEDIEDSDVDGRDGPDETSSQISEGFAIT